MGGRSSSGSRNTSSNELSQSQWEQNNTKAEQKFAEWLDSKDKRPFEVDRYNVFEKMTLNEAQKWLKPNSAAGYSYNDSDEVPEDTWYTVRYEDGTQLRLEPGDSLKGVKRTGIVLCVQENTETTAIYSKNGSSGIYIYNSADYEENNDIWQWDSPYIR